MTTYFSVDVETTGPLPIHHSLLSVGIVVVKDNGEPGDTYYSAIWHENLKWEASTREWWDSQEESTYLDARNKAKSAWCVAHDIESFARTQEPNASMRCFVANPVAFDWPWINNMFYEANVPNPFGYRALCLRSMHFGMRNIAWNSERETWGEFLVKPDIPHHALSDAAAQAEELRLMLKARSPKNG